MKIAKRLIVLLLALAGLTSSVSAQTVESVGMITEIKMGKGRVEVKEAGKPTSRPAAPFLALRAGDTVHATDDALVVILLTAGRGAVKVDASSSPYVAMAPVAGASKLQKAQALVASSVRYLGAIAPEPPKAVLTVRSVARPPVIVSPRNTAVLPGPL